jgi:hypothetical protein
MVAIPPPAGSKGNAPSDCVAEKMRLIHNFVENVLLVVAATILGPILAVQAQKMVERLREARERKLRVFYSLMGTRAARTSPEHVQSLNLIDLLFRRKGEKPIIDAWEVYREHLNQDVEKMTPSQMEAWTSRSSDLFIDVMYAMSVALGYHFTKPQLQRGIYTPRAHNIADIEQQAIRHGAAMVLSGNQPIKMEVTAFPVSEDALKLQKEVQEALIDTLTKQRVLSVRIVGEDAESSSPKNYLAALPSPPKS